MERKSSRQRDLFAGDFASWLERIKTSLKLHHVVNVPCGECTSCCRSSQFIHVGRDETETLARIPQKLLFPAPGPPKGDLLMGHNQRGCCPMLVDDGCSIYAHRLSAIRFLSKKLGKVFGRKIPAWGTLEDQYV